MNYQFKSDNTSFSFENFYKELEKGLPDSSYAQRKVWAKTILVEEISIESLVPLLNTEKRLASRFLYLLSDIGEINPKRLLADLPYLFALSKTIKHLNIQPAFPSFWNIADVPKENEGEAIDLLFKYFNDPKLNTTTKSRALFVLLRLVKAYPELKNELKLSLEDQKDRYSASFRQRCEGALKIM